MRYQVNTTTNSHKFCCGTTISFTITNGVGNSGSDIRWKSEIEDIDESDALDKVCRLKAKKFKYMNSEGKQLGFIAQDVHEVAPELVYIDESTDDKFMFLQYDRFSALHNESIKQLFNKINKLEERITFLENKI